MNQILLTDNYNNDRKNSNNKNVKPPKTNSTDLRKIILFFAIVIIVFGVAIGGVYGYKIYKNTKNGGTQEINKPELSLEKYDDVAEVTIIAKSEVGIDKIIYSWNDEEVIETELYGRTSQEEKIDVPQGENILKVKVVDIYGQEKETTERFLVNIDKPTIETAVVENGKLKITATADVPMEYITYKWNDEEEVKIEAETDLDTSIEEIIDIKRGKNDITITAVSSINGIETINKTFMGVNEPEIYVIKDEEQGKLYMKVSHDLGVKKIEFEVNGNTYVYDENAPGYAPDRKEVEYYFNLREGENTVIITATSAEDTQKEYKGICTY